MRRLRHLRPPRRGRHHRARPARPAAPRPGSRRHRLLRRQPLSFGTPPRPRRRHLLPPRGDRPPTRQHGRRPCPLFHHRRDDPAQRAAAVRRAQCRRPCGRPQRQPHQRPDATPRAREERRDDAVDNRHRGDPAPGRPLQAQPLHRALRRRAARDRRRLCAGLAHQQEAGRRARSARHPPPGARRTRRLPDPDLGDLRARHHRRALRPRHRTRRSHRVRREGPGHPQAVPADGAASLHLRIHLLLPAGFHRARTLGLRGPQGLRRAARAREPRADRRRRSGAGFRRARRDRLQPAFRRTVRDSASSATIMSAAPSSSRPRRSANPACA